MPAKRFTFAHLADAHIGAWPRDAALRKALRASLLRALRVVEERNCAFLLVSGDLFHTPVPDPGEVAPVAEAFRRLTEQGRSIYLIYGSHDYVAHRTSWLDVLGRSGLFVNTAPEAVRTEGERWSLPYHVDADTGAVIGGIPGRAHGLDRSYFAGVDTREFRRQEGFRIFQFHAAIPEYLPSGLREHVRGVARSDLPRGCHYYAGGHIHRSYVGEGPDGGLLVNPGAVFGTSLPDLEHVANGSTHAGLVIVTVEDDRPRHEFIETGPKDSIRFVDLDVTGKSSEDAKAELGSAVDAAAEEGVLLFPRLHGTLAEGGVAALGLPDVTGTARERGVATVHWDVRDLASPSSASDSDTLEGDVEAKGLARLFEAARTHRPEFAGEDGALRFHDLFRELGTPRGEGESKTDYETTRITSATRALEVGRRLPR